MSKYLSVLVLATLLAVAHARGTPSTRLGRTLLQGSQNSLQPAPIVQPQQSKFPDSSVLITQPRPQFDASLGLGFFQGGSASFRGLDGNCVTQSVSLAAGGVNTVGSGSADVNGNVASQSACGDNARPFDIGISQFGGFVSTQSVQTKNDDCRSSTTAFGNVQSVNLGDIDSSASGGVGGSSACDTKSSKLASGADR